MTATRLTTQATIIPIGGNSTRPTSPVAGDTRFNTDINALEFYDGTSWTGIGVLDGSSQSTAAPSASYIKNLTGTTTSGTYWIKTADMATGVEVYCDMSYDSGGYMLLAYGYVGTTNDSGSNWNIPNLNHDASTFSYNPTSRSSTHGLVPSPNGQKSALLIARNSSTLLMAAGSNPSTGGIDGYSYVYKFSIPSPSSLTFNNHSKWYNTHTVSTVSVNALKGDSGNYTRYTQTQALGSSWSDSYPTGYGAVSTSNPTSGTFNAGPFFPSLHSGSGHSGTIINFSSSPDLGYNGYESGNRTYTYRGWYRANGAGYTGQTSLWFK